MASPRRKIRVGGLVPPLLVLAVVFSAGACQQDPTGRDGTLSARQFVEIIVEIRDAERTVEREVMADSVEVEFERRKAAILERHDATEADLHAFVERHYQRPGLMSAVWDSIAQRLRTVPTDGTSATPLDDYE